MKKSIINGKYFCYNDDLTLGKIKNWENEISEKDLICIGRLNVGLLKQMLKHLKNTNDIGIYLNKYKELDNCHCKGWVIAPRVIRDGDEQKKNEF